MRYRDVAAKLALLALVKCDSPNGYFGGRADYAVGFGGAPLCNGVLLVLSLACTPLVKRASGGASVLKYVIGAIVLPVAAYAADFVLIADGFMLADG